MGRRDENGTSGRFRIHNGLGVIQQALDRGFRPGVRVYQTYHGRIQFLEE
jgi:hypothetical protein